MSRDAPPPLEFVEPDCPMCGAETEVEDGDLICNPCEAMWSLPDYCDPDGADWINGGDVGPQCAVEHWQTPVYPPDMGPRVVGRCVRTADHDGNHVDQHGHLIEVTA